MSRVVTLDLIYRYGIYAIVITTDDVSCYDDLCYLHIFLTKEEYDEFVKYCEETYIYTGESWCTLYKKKDE